ncbi:hypothetical protein [Marinobacter salsuginis]|nr:hypothetical protein [Marinobacter salsuginis]
MNMVSGLIGFGSFFICLLAIGALGYWKADNLEAWANKRFPQRKKPHE